MRPGRPRAVFLIVSSGAVLATLDQFVVNLAFPSISRDLHGTVAAVSWILSGYSIVFAALLIPAGRLADRNGRRGGFLAGITVFTLASAACAFSTSLGQLIAARVVQGSAAALLVPSSLGLLLASRPPERRAGAIRAWAAMIGASGVLGPVAGGLLLTLSWRWIFLINVPIGITAIILAARMIAPVPAEGGPLPDFAGAALAAAAVGGLSLGLVEAPGWGWNSPRTTGAFAAAALLACLFAWRSRRHPSPVLELSLLRVPRFGIAAAGAVLYGATYASALLSITLWVQTGWNWSPLHFGLVFAGGPLTVFLLAPGTGRIIRLAGVAATATTGSLLLAASALVRIAVIGPAPSYLAVLPVVLLTGLGVALTLPTLTSAGSDALPPHRLATGSGVLSMARQLGLSVGIAVAVSILGGTGHGHARLASFQHAWIAAAALGVAGAAVAILLFRHGPGGAVTPADESQMTADPGPPAGEATTPGRRPSTA